MDAALNRTSLMYGVPGIILQFGGGYVERLFGYTHMKEAPIGVDILHWFIFLGGTALLMVGLSYYAAAKGHSRWAGLLGLLSIIGIIVLAVLPDKRKA